MPKKTGRDAYEEILKGAKRVLLGDDTYVYDPQHFLITSVDRPTVVQIIEASREKPYLGIILKLDQRLFGDSPLRDITNLRQMSANEMA